MADCCRDFTRSQALRHAAVEAGRGLPAIEPGMPVPAGTGLTRRSVLLRAAGAALSVYGASRLAPEAFEAGIAEAATGPAKPVLVSVFLPGGLDSLSMLAPVGDPAYATLRPTLRLAAGTGTAFSEDSRLMWHPQAAGLATLHAEGKVTAFPAIGYAGPDQSHFTSRHYWEVGALDPAGRHGWMGRYLDRAGVADNPLQGMSLDGTLSPALAAARVPVCAVPKPDDYGFWSRDVGDPIIEPMLRAIGELGAAPTTDPVLVRARQVAGDVDFLRRQLAPFAGRDGQPSWTSPVPYPTGDFGARLGGLAAMLAAGLPLRCVSVNAPGGYDTHANQVSSLGKDIRRVGDNLLAFQRDLEARGLADRVLTLVWSEFGRRPRENGSGTDHGAGGCAFVVGSRASGRMVGEFTGLGTLDRDGNLRSSSDFRALYGALLEQWMGVDAADVLPGAAGLVRPTVVRA